MSKINDLLKIIAKMPDCHLNLGLNARNSPKNIPTDLLEFYEFCNGATLFSNSEYSIKISPLEKLLPSNEVILGEQFDDDISRDWFVLAECSPGEYVSIDLSENRNGWCYDSFSEVHAVAGSCPIIGKSFSYFLEKCIENNGDYFYWLKDTFKNYGDAYDCI